MRHIEGNVWTGKLFQAFGRFNRISNSKAYGINNTC